jgi:hypothetical protein
MLLVDIETLLALLGLVELGVGPTQLDVQTRLGFPKLFPMQIIVSKFYLIQVTLAYSYLIDGLRNSRPAV